jgi:hypothetical protein
VAPLMHLRMITTRKAVALREQRCARCDIICDCSNSCGSVPNLFKFFRFTNL